MAYTRCSKCFIKEKEELKVRIVSSSKMAFLNRKKKKALSLIGSNILPSGNKALKGLRALLLIQKLASSVMLGSPYFSKMDFPYLHNEDKK